jgi:hypothetical protein
MRQSTLLLPAAFAANRRPSLPPPPLSLPPGRHRLHRLHRHHRGQTFCCPLPKKEATAAAPPAYQRQHQCQNVYKSRQLDLFNLSTVSRKFSECTFFAINILVDALLYRTSWNQLSGYRAIGALCDFVWEKKSDNQRKEKQDRGRKSFQKKTSRLSKYLNNTRFAWAGGTFFLVVLYVVSVFGSGGKKV